MKKLIFIIIATFLVCGCSEDKIELKNPNTYTEDSYFKTAKQFEEAVHATYAGLYHQGLWAREWYFIFDLLGQDAAAASPLSGNLAPFQAYSFSQRTGHLENVWHSLYRIVTRANFVISLKDEEIDIDEEMENKFLGEARFLRAWAYFQLANLWGDVPLRTNYDSTKVEENYNKKRTSKSKILDLVEEDLSYAKGVLPESHSDANVGRATKGAATALLGKVYLFREKFDKAITEFQAVESSGNYALIDKYENNFIASHDNNSETIFSVQFAVTGGNDYWMFGGQESWGGGATHSGRSMEYGWNDWANVYVAEEAVYTYRYDSAEAAAEYVDPRAEQVFYGNEEIGDTDYADHTSEGPISYSYEDQGFRWRKYCQYEFMSKEYYPQSGINAVVIRYADVLLMHAEALIRSGGNESDAIDLINQVRARSGAYEYDLAEEDESALELLKRERRLELLGEQKRYFDLVRWGELQETLNSEFGDQRVKPKHDLFPIPQHELDVNEAIEVENNWN